MKERSDYYSLLHVQPDAPADVIRASYRALMLKLRLHPDLGGDRWDAILINAAYATLVDPKKREAYDRSIGQDSQEERRQKVVEPPLQLGREKKPAPACPFCREPVATGSQACSRCTSPLTPAERTCLGSGKRRGITRMAKEGEITLYAEWPGKGRPCRIRDISPHGMQIVAGEPLPKGQVIKLEGDLLGAVARVANCRIRHQGSLLRYAVGLEFLTLRFHHLHGTFVSLTV